MFCPHCNAQWELPNDNKIRVTSCPFCNESLYTELKEPYSTETVFKEIGSRFGTDILLDSEELVSTFTVLAPKLETEKQCLLFFKACGGFDNFINLQSDKKEKNIEFYNNQIKQMTDIITEVCRGLLTATGISEIVDTSNMDEMTAPTVEWEYTNLGNDTIEIVACKEQLSAEIVFPCYIDGKKVVSIGSSVFGAAKTKGADRLRVESIFVPQSVTSIKSGAFSGCKSLKIISLPKGLLSIGDEVFRNCKLLTSVSIPDSVTYIGNGAFSGSGIRSAVWPSSVTAVSKEAFKNCKQLLDVTILDGVSTIQKEAFSGCSSLANIVLPVGMKVIEALAFCECKKLNSIVLPDTIDDIGDLGFKYCTSLTTINLPEKVKTLEYEVFYGCGFSSFVIPEHITKIDDFAFANCWSLRKIIIPKSVTKIESDTFFNIDSEIVIACYKDSYAHKWASRHRINIELL